MKKTQQNEQNEQNEQEEHESYGMIGISSISGTSRHLFGSSIQHGHTIEIKLSECTKEREYQREHYYASKVLARIEMSAAQFANFMTSMNINDGVPCTIRHIVGDKEIRENPPDINFKKQANKELNQSMRKLGNDLKELKDVSEKILSKKGALKKAEKAELLRSIESVRCELDSNIPFIHECFNEAVEKTVMEAKSEIDASLQQFQLQMGKKNISAEIISKQKLLG